jgi:hypothetical protein
MTDITLKAVFAGLAWISYLRFQTTEDESAENFYACISAISVLLMVLYW